MTKTIGGSQLQARSTNNRKGALAAAYVGAFALAGAAIAGGSQAENGAANLREIVRAEVAAQGVEPLSAAPEQSAAMVELGRLLFFDTELSGNRNISCATCHHPAFGAGDGLSVSFGSGGLGLGSERLLGEGELIPRNAPEIFNRADPLWRSMFWDSRVEVVDGVYHSPAGDQLPEGFTSPLAIQAMFPVTSSEEMRGQAGDLDVDGNPNELAALDDSDFTGIWQRLMARILAIPDYAALFSEVYPDVPAGELTFQHAAEAIAAFEADAFTMTDSPWDQWLAGEESALSDQQIRGADLFFGAAGCSTCHSGTLLTDQAHHNIGTPQVGPGRGASRPLDFGRLLITNDPGDLFTFRTPPLRNVAVSGPWMHNGAFHSLEQAVRHHFGPELCWAPTFEFVSMEPEVEATLQRSPELRNVVMATLDPAMPTYRPSDRDIADLLAFLDSLTSPSVDLMGEQVPDRVPSGRPVETAAPPSAY